MKVAMLSAWHVHANDYAKKIMQVPGCEIVAVWDEVKERGEKWATQLNCKFYEDVDQLLAQNDIDGVMIDSPTDMHKELMLKACAAKKHIFTEKVLTLTTDDALEVKKAVEDNGIKLVISFPHLCRGDLRLAKEIAKSGKLGQVTYVRIRNAHDGSSSDWLPPHFYDEKQCGGGATVDLGAHGFYLMQWLLGKAVAISSTFTNATDRPVEDNAVSVFTFENGAIGVAETGFVSKYSPFILEIYGTNGSLLVRDGVSYANVETEGKWVQAEGAPEALPHPVNQWANAVMKNESIAFDINLAVDLTAAMEAAYESYRKQQAVSVIWPMPGSNE